MMAPTHHLRVILSHLHGVEILHVPSQALQQLSPDVLVVELLHRNGDPVQRRPKHSAEPPVPQAPLAQELQPIEAYSGYGVDARAYNGGGSSISIGRVKWLVKEKTAKLGWWAA